MGARPTASLCTILGARADFKFAIHCNCWPMYPALRLIASGGGLAFWLLWHFLRLPNTWGAVAFVVEKGCVCDCRASLLCIRVCCYLTFSIFGFVCVCSALCH